MSKLVSHYNQMFDGISLVLHMPSRNGDGTWSIINHMLTFGDGGYELVKKYAPYQVLAIL